MRHHRQGNLQQAEEAYRQILQVDPNQADALYLLGVIAHQVGRNDVAIQYISQAVLLTPLRTEFRNTLGEAYWALGKLDEAVAEYRQALHLRLDFPEAHYNLGNALYAQGKLDEAVGHYRHALRLRPDFANAHSNLGAALHALGRQDEAVEHCRHALRLRPDLPEAHCNLGNALHALGRLDEAIQHDRLALRLRPNFAEAHYNLGTVLEKQGQLDAALAHFKESLRLRPNSPEALNNLGGTLQKQGQLDAALAHFKEALRLQPNSPEALNNLGNALQKQGQLDAALAHLQEALRLRPNFPEAQNNLGTTLQKQGQLDTALAHFKEALRLRPNFPEAQNNLATALQEKGRLAQAVVEYREALRLMPADAATHSNLLFCMSHDAGVSPDELFAEHCRWGELHGTVPGPIHPHANDPSPERRLRIGYVSPDFRAHALASFVVPILAHHDHSQVEVFCYSAVAVPDGITRRLQHLAHAWRAICGLADAQVVEQIRADRIDVLVDLAGHTANHRLRVFAHKPAPVQVAYLGYPGTTGLRAIGYRLTDAVLEPPGEPVRSTEELVRLSRGKYCFAPRDDAPEVVPPPVQRLGRITFGSFHRLSKINAGVLDVWCQLLHALPSARIIVLRDTLAGSSKDELLKQFLQRGVRDEQLDLRPAAEAGGYMKVFAEVDISLETFPYNAVTLSCESLWMGVPFATLRGDRPAGRAGATILSRVGLPDLIAETADELVERTVELAKDVNRLTVLRRELRGRMRETLCDGATFTRGLEAVYREMWRDWCALRSLASRQPDLPAGQLAPREH